MTAGSLTKIAICVIVAVIATILVYYGLQDSLNRPTLSRIPLPSETAIAIVADIEQDNKDTIPLDPKNLSTRYVYIKGNGTFFESKPNSFTIGKYLGSTGEPTITTGNHYAWEVIDKRIKVSYFVDSITGELVGKSGP